MRGISEEGLRELVYGASADERNMLEFLIRTECQELTPWQPIDENTPKDRRILLFYPNNVGFRTGQLVNWDSPLVPRHFAHNLVAFLPDGISLEDVMDKHIWPTHWMDLPPNPELPENPRE